ncbi:Single-stranded DNA-binding protein [Prochlorococcus marinus str. MIT 9515]|uniref:Single-stranded DNA-binding protein n=1 Tax=Prochlorococcus marinus (strain MIT 9515) TaxID=167542 RepID=A2BVG4_PROM5|nr:single-stranded DNA-binding protein [Prochlorococcus marinus]ABM71775.1 Single-stranded DNA-binding protein [Prochlorococcus marinus str. MIT 9515]
MNHCLIQAVINSSPQMRYTKDNKTPIAEMTVIFKGLRNEDPSRELKVLGWGNIAQEMVSELKEGQNIVIEGRLRMNSITRQDGTKEKQPELTASRIHNISPAGQITSEGKETNISRTKDSNSSEEKSGNTENTQWNSSPLVPEVDEIPF